MKINLTKLTEKNKSEVNRLLKEVNGKATDHVFLSWYYIDAEAKRFASHVNKYLNVKDSKGVMAIAISSKPVARAYKWQRKVTRIKLEIGSGGNVFLTNIESDYVYNDGGGEMFIDYNEEQKSKIAQKAIDNAAKA